MSIPPGKRENSLPTELGESDKPVRAGLRSNTSTNRTYSPETAGKSAQSQKRDGSTRVNAQPTTPTRVPRNANRVRQIGPTIVARDAQKWERVLAQLKARLGPEAYVSWFGRCRLESISKSQLTVSVPTTFLKSWIKSHYGDLLLELWQKQASDILRVDIVMRSAVRSANSENGEAASQAHNQRALNTQSSEGPQTDRKGIMPR